MVDCIRLEVAASTPKSASRSDEAPEVFADDAADPL
jgi:hypothetical protein